MEDRGRHRTNSFVARIWLEYDEDGTPRWRGRIRHVQNGRQVCFEDLKAMHEFLEEMTGMPVPRLVH